MVADLQGSRLLHTNRLTDKSRYSVCSNTPSSQCCDAA